MIPAGADAGIITPEELKAAIDSHHACQAGDVRGRTEEARRRGRARGAAYEGGSRHVEAVRSGHGAYFITALSTRTCDGANRQFERAPCFSVVWFSKVIFAGRKVLHQIGDDIFPGKKNHVERKLHSEHVNRRTRHD